MEKNVRQPTQFCTRALTVVQPHRCRLSYKTSATRNAEMMAPDRLRCGVAKFTQKVPIATLLFIFGHGYPTQPHIAPDTQLDPRKSFDARLPDHPV